MFNLLQPQSFCPHFAGCSGCSESLLSNPPPLWKEILSFFEGSARSVLYQGSPIHWRHRAKVAVRGTPGNPLIGLFKRASHDVFPIPNCLVHHPHLNQAFEIINQWMKRHTLAPYQEKTGQGDLRYLQGVIERKSGKVQMTFVLNTSDHNTLKAQHWHTLLLQLAKDHSCLWHSLWMNFNTSTTNNIFGDPWFLVSGEECLWETFGTVDVCYGAASFGQANLPLFEKMLLQLRHLIPEQARVAEFYAGVGVIGLFIASRCAWVRCSEINPHAEAYFKQSRSRLPLQEATKLTFYTSSAQTSLQIIDGASVVIVDPPRKGLDTPFFLALNASKTVQQLIYISCDWEAFKQDCKRLCSEGWSITCADGYHFFPGSNHVELLVSFKR